MLDRCFQGEEIHYEAWFRFAGDQDHFMAISYLPLNLSSQDIQEIVVIARDLTERKHMEEALEFSEKRYRSLINNAPICFHEIDVAGKVLSMNPAGIKMIGIENEAEIVGRSYLDLLEEDDSERVKAYFPQACKGQSVEFEFQVTKNGKTHYYWKSFTPVRNAQDILESVMGIAEDITERKLAEKTVLESEQQLRTILDAMTNFVRIGSVDGIVLDCNQASLTMAGLTWEDVIGKNFVDTYWLNYSPKIQDKVRDTIQRVSQGEIVREDYLARMGEDLYITVDACYVPVKDTNGQVVKIVHSGIDVTERRQAEDALQQSEDQFRDLYESAPLAYFSASLDGHITRVNGRATELLGYSQKEFIGKHVLTLYAPTKDGHEKAAILQNKTQEGISIQDEELEMARKDGTVLWVSLMVRLIYDQSGKIIERRGMVQDISSRKKVEIALKKSEERFRTYFQTGLVGMTMTSVEKGWLEVNNRFCAMLGYSREELQKKNWAELTYPDDLLQNESQFNQLLSGTVPSYTMEKRFIRKDGSLMFTNLYVNAVRKPSGHVEYITAMIQDITEQKQSESLLMKWATIFQHTQWGVAVGNADSPNLDLVNEAYARMHGYTVEELQGQPIAQVFVPEFRSQLPAFIKKIHEVGFQSMESQHLRKDGTTFPALLTVSAIKDSQGVALYRVANLIDISDLKHTEQALLESQQIYQDLVQTIEGIVWECDFPSFQVTFVSQYAKQLLGYPLQQWHDDPQFLGNIIHADERPGILDYCYQTSLKKENHIMEYRVLHANGSILCLRDQVTVIVKDDQPVKLRGIMVDITEQKKIESELKESEQRFRTMFEQAAVGVAQVDSNTGGFIKINQRYCDIVDYSQEEMRAKTFQDLTHTDDLPTNLDNMRNLVSGELLNVSREKRYIRKDGTTVWIDLAVSPMWQTGEAPSHHITVVQNITERKMMEHVIRQQHEKLEETVQRRTERIQELEQRRMQVEKLAALSQIAAGVAHEINNPLASISQSLVLLKRALSPKHPHFRYMAKPEDCIDRIAQITKNLYQLYRPSGPIPTPVDLRMCIRTATEIMEERAFKHGMRITITSLLQPVICQVPQGELIQVLCNLIHNAIDASAPDGTIEVSLTTGSKTLSLSVTDHGEGISPDAASHIFKPFFTTKQNRVEGGMGLGLSISHSLVESMGGNLDFSTSIGQGSTFTITLPHE